MLLRIIWSKKFCNVQYRIRRYLKGYLCRLGLTNGFRSTRLWRIVRNMPKGTLLHAHIGATVDLEWVFNQAIETPGMVISSPVPLDSDSARQAHLVRIKYSSSREFSSPSIW